MELPPTDSTTQSWWDATREHRLVVQECRSCGHRQHYPRAVCLSCHSTDLGWTDVTGQGRLVSFTVVHRAPDPSFEVPYVVALVQLDEGPTMMTNIVDCDRELLQCDQPVVLAWRDLEDGRALPVFRIASQSTHALEGK